MGCAVLLHNTKYVIIISLYYLSKYKVIVRIYLSFFNSQFSI